MQFLWSMMLHPNPILIWKKLRISANIYPRTDICAALGHTLGMMPQKDLSLANKWWWWKTTGLPYNKYAKEMLSSNWINNLTVFFAFKLWFCDNNNNNKIILQPFSRIILVSWHDVNQKHTSSLLCLYLSNFLHFSRSIASECCPSSQKWRACDFCNRCILLCWNLLRVAQRLVRWRSRSMNCHMY